MEPQGGGGFEAAIVEIDRQIEELQRTRDTLVRLSARPLAASPASHSAKAAPVVGDSVAVVREQEFSGMSIAKAAAALLRKIGRHEKTPVIIAALQKGGVEVRGKSPVSTVYTTLSRRPAFVSLGKNYWDLAERRPDLVGIEKKVRPRAAKGVRRRRLVKLRRALAPTPSAPTAASA
jgi:hypothetical protein